MNSKWFIEKTTEYEGSFYSFSEILFTGRSEFQKIEIIVSDSYGKMLILDDKIQSTEGDEFIYHETLVHPAMVLLQRPQKIFIAGGGEGATAREILKYDSVEKIVMVDLDKIVVDVSKRYLNQWHQGAFDNPKVNIHYKNAREYLENNSEKFDAIIADLPEPFEDGPTILLYTKEFYECVFKNLKQDGVFITQATSVSVSNLKVFAAIISTLKTIFPIVRPYITHIPSFYLTWGFVIASKRIDPCSIESKNIDEKIKGFADKLIFYDSKIHKSLFTLPKYITEYINNKKIIITDTSPLSFY